MAVDGIQIPSVYLLPVNKVRFRERLKEKPIFYRQVIRLREKLQAARTSFFSNQIEIYTLELNKILIREGVINR
jgi:hypothetical protein